MKVEKDQRAKDDLVHEHSPRRTAVRGVLERVFEPLFLDRTGDRAGGIELDRERGNIIAENTR